MPKDPTNEIIQWAATQPAWRRDALRRLLVGAFSKADEDECYELLRAEHGACTTTLKADALDAKHLPVRSASAVSVKLISLDNIANVNRLASDAAFTPAKSGLTLIYGDNGSGKSGFTRILKKACRARDHKETILPDVFAKGLPVPATATFTVEDSGKALPAIAWTDGPTFSSDVLARIAIFDSRCASVHVDGDNKLEVIPHNLDCFEKLAQLCDKLRLRAKAECDALNLQLAGVAIAPPPGTKAASFVAALPTKTESDLSAEATFSSEQTARLTALAEMLKDPLAEAKRLERIEAALRKFAGELSAVLTAVSDAKAQEIVTLRNSAAELRKQADLSAEAAFASDPIPAGVGGGPWRAMFEAARDYSETALPGQAFPVTAEDAHCVLCQQELDAAAKDRFERFSSFVLGAMNAKAASEEAKFEAALVAIRPATLTLSALDAEATAFLDKHRAALGTEQKTVFDALTLRRTQILAGKEYAAIPENDAVKSLGAVADELNKSAKDARALAASGADAAALKSEHAELTGRKTLSDNADELKRRISIHQSIAKLQAAMNACSTKEISTHGSKLLKEYITGELRTALADEQKALGLTDIPLALHDSTPKGAIHHRLKLNDATLAADTSDILSEGEQRAVALAAFLSELKMYPGQDAIIIDDPVSSLDHIRRGKVAERLVSEAKGRQVIVFTHDLVFLSECRYFSAKASVPIEVRGIRRGPNGFGTKDPDGDPWATKSIPGRRQWLSEQLVRLKKLHLEASDQYEPQLRFFYDRLRESWERLIEENVFAGVISRFQPQVQTLRLNRAVLDDDIFEQIYFGMTAVSNYTGHDRAAAKGGALADPQECQKDFEAFTKCLADIEALAKTTEQARNAKIKPPKAAAS